MGNGEHTDIHFGNIQGNVVTGEQVQQMVYHGESASNQDWTDRQQIIDQLNELIAVLSEVKDAVEQSNKPRAKATLRKLAGSGMQFISDVASNTLANAISKLLGF